MITRPESGATSGDHYHTSLQVVPDPRLRECNYGELNGMATHRLEDERVRHVDEAWPGGESYRQVVARTAELLGELLATWDATRILLVGHSANKWALDHLLLGRDLTDLVAADFAWQEGWEYLVRADPDAHEPTGH
jgi:broad specificity phosphatase PhoE